MNEINKGENILDCKQSCGYDGPNYSQLAHMRQQSLGRLWVLAVIVSFYQRLLVTILPLSPSCFVLLYCHYYSLVKVWRGGMDFISCEIDFSLIS